MYQHFYHMNTKPFQNYPASHIFFPSNVHKGGWNFLIHGIKDKEPFLLITGNYGSGKTMLCQKLLHSLERKNFPLHHVFIPVASYSYTDILTLTATTLSLDIQNIDRKDIQSVLFRYLEEHSVPEQIYILVDDVHEFDHTALDKLRILANYNIRSHFPFKLIIFAHSSFLSHLKKEPLTSLDQRIQRRYHLTPLDFHETKEYIYFRLLRSGVQGQPTFDNEALDTIYSRSGGFPRLINNICDASLLYGAAERLTVINPQTVYKALDYLGEQIPLSVQPQEQNKPASDNFVQPGSDFSFNRPANEQVQPSLTTPSGNSSEGDNGGRGTIDFTSISTEQTNSQHRENSINASAAPPFFSFHFPSLKRSTLAWLVIIFLSLFIVGFLWRHDVIGTISHIDPRTQAHDDFQKNDSKHLDPIHKENVYPPHVLMSRDKMPNTYAQKQDGADISQLTLRQNAGNDTLRKSLHTYVDPSDDHPFSYNSLSKQEPDTAIPDQMNNTPRNMPYSLVLSSCRERINAARVLEKFEKKGLLSLTIAPSNSHGSSKWWMVYYGRYANEAEAKEMREKLNLKNALITKVPFTASFGRFNSLDKAKRRYTELRSKGHYPYILEKNSTYLVCLGAYTTHSHALSIYNNNDNFKQDPQVIQL